MNREGNDGRNGGGRRQGRPDGSRHGDARPGDAYRRDGYENAFGQDDDARRGPERRDDHRGFSRMAYDRSYDATSTEFSSHDDRYNQGDYGMGGYVRNSDHGHGMGNSGPGRYGQNVDQSRYGQGGFGQGAFSQSGPQNHGQGFDQGFRTYGDRARDRYVSNDSMGARPSGQDFAYGRHGDNTPGYGPMGQGNYATRYAAGQGDSGANYGDYGSPYSPTGGMGGSGYGARETRRGDDADFSGDPHDRRGTGAFGSPGSAGSFQMRGGEAERTPDRGERNGFGQGAMGYSAGMTSDYLERTGRRDALTGPGAPGRGRAMRGPKGYMRSDERVREDVCETLGGHHELDASEIEVLVSGGVVTLAGTVDQGRDRRLAEEIVEHLPGVRDVRNEIRVNRGIGHAIGKAISNVFGGHASEKRDNATNEGSRVDLESRAAFQDFKADASNHGDRGNSTGSPAIPASERAGTLANPAGGTGTQATRPASEALSNNSQAGSTSAGASAPGSTTGARSGEAAH